MTYLLEFRLGGYARKYSQGLIYDLARKFRIRGMKGKVSHISLFGPFTTSKEREVISTIQDICRKYQFVAFKFEDFNHFNNPNNKVIYLNVVPSDDLKNIRYQLAQGLLKVTKTISNQDRKGPNDFRFHSTLAFKDIDRKFNQILDYLKNKEPPKINQYLLRVTLLNRGRIVCEYDLLQRRLLNRRQALNKHVFGETVRILRGGKSEFNKHMYQSQTQQEVTHTHQNQKSIFDKIKSWFKW